MTLDNEIAPPRRGMFTRDFLREYGESSPADIHRSYRTLYKGRVTSRGTKYRLGTYNSWMAYLSRLIIAGLVEYTEREEMSRFPQAEQLTHPEKVFVKLTDKGLEAPDYVWAAPTRIWRKPFDWELVQYADYIDPEKR